jgi:hypothetical protein
MYSCFTFYKGNKISANHNTQNITICVEVVVSPSTKVIKFQLITTNEKDGVVKTTLFHLLQR